MSERLLRFVLLDPFVKAWRAMKLDDEDQRALEAAIMADPKGAPVVAGTGGLRKLRFAPPGSDRGKRGGVRVGYVYFPRHAIVLLATAYPKNVKADLSAPEKVRIKALIEEIGGYLATQSPKHRHP